MALNSSSTFGGSFGGYAVCTFNFGEKPVEPLGGFLSNQNVERMQVRRSVVCPTYAGNMLCHIKVIC